MSVLKLGDKNSNVALVQYVLQQIGYNPGQIDGNYGSATQKAVADFQDSVGLINDGKIDDFTYRKLEPYIYGYKDYISKTGDDFYKIANNFGTSVNAIQVANPDLNPVLLSAGTSIKVPYGFDVVKTNVPYTYEVLEYDLQGLKARYPFISVESIGKSVEGKSLYRVSLGKGINKVTYNGSHHANEWITTPVLMKWIEEFLKAFSNRKKLKGYEVKDIWRQSVIDIVPMVNPDGVNLVINGITADTKNAEQLLNWNYGSRNFNDWRANIKGVDLNRNYPAEWDIYKEVEADLGITGPAPAFYGGAMPNNQPEVKAMMRLTESQPYRLVLAYHTQGEIIFWNFMNKQPPESRSIGEAFSKVSGYALVNPSINQSYAGYKDWFIEKYYRPGYTIECGKGENPLSLDQFGTIYEQNEELLILASTL